MKRFLRLAVTSLVMMLALFPASLVYADSGVLLSTEMITRGVKLEQWNYPTSAGTAKVSVVEVDLQEPYIKIDAIYGKDGKTGSKQTITNMAAEEGAIAAINGDFFTLNAEGAPFGVTVKDGEMINSPGYISSKSALVIDEDGEPSIQRVDFYGQVTAADGSSFQLFGLNKTMYNAGYSGYTGKSHYNRLHMYDSRWNPGHWVGDSLGASYTTVVVKDDVVTDILRNQGVGQIPSDTYVLLAHGTAEDWVNQHIQVGDTLDVDMTLLPDEDIVSAIDGSTLLVQNGQKAPITYEIKGNVARTAVGYSADKRFLYLVSVEKSGSSVGMTLDQLSDFLVSKNVYDAVNLDGGGSTTMVVRGLGTFSLKNAVTPQYGTQRAVPNGLAVFTEAPEGDLKNVNMSVSASTVLVGETVTVKLSSAYDEYYNPVDTKNLNVDWDEAEGAEISQANGVSTISFSSPGDYYLTCDIEGLEKAVSVHVVGKEDIARLELDKSSIQLNPGGSVTLKPSIILKDGTKKTVSPKLLTWTLKGVQGQVSDAGILTAAAVSTGTLNVGYEGFEISVPVTVKEAATVNPGQPSNPAAVQLKFVIGQDQVLVNEKPRKIPQAPQVVNGRTYLPLRAYAELLGASVQWNIKEQKVEIKYNGKELNFWSGKTEMTVDGVKSAVDAPPFIENGSTMVPLRAAGEAFGMYIDYRQGVQSITVTAR